MNFHHVMQRFNETLTISCCFAFLVDEINKNEESCSSPHSFLFRGNIQIDNIHTERQTRVEVELEECEINW